MAYHSNVNHLGDEVTAQFHLHLSEVIHLHFYSHTANNFFKLRLFHFVDMFAYATTHPITVGH